MKHLLLIPLLLTTSCAALAPAVVIQGSRAANHIAGGKDCQTLTESAYERKLQGELRGEIEDAAYTAMFFPFDAAVALAMGEPEAIGSHGEVTELYIEHIPFCEVKENYGGYKYNQMLK
jgi:hypothetical protein